MEIEYQKRRPVMCKFPYSGVTINPDGHFVPCCNAPNVSLGHLSKVESLKQFINGHEQGMLRDKFKKSEWFFFKNHHFRPWRSCGCQKRWHFR